MNPHTPLVISKGVRAIVGKGSTDDATRLAMKEHGCIFLAAASGCAMIHAEGVERVLDVHWLDLGTTEALWVIEARDWGPLTVAMDSKGNNLFRNVRERAEKKLRKMMRALPAGKPTQMDAELLWD